MTGENPNPYQKKIFTIPNLLSMLRLCMIPVIVWLYTQKQDYPLTTCVLILSAVTDIVDGIIARKWGMVSDFGKILDPVADKLTQFVTLLCLFSRFPYMLIPAVLLVVKELFAAVTGLLTIRRTGTVMSAQWHGKTATVSLYAMMMLHLVCYNMAPAVSYILVGVCTGIMLLSAVLYGIRNIRVLARKGGSDERN